MARSIFAMLIVATFLVSNQAGVLLAAEAADDGRRELPLNAQERDWLAAHPRIRLGDDFVWPPFPMRTVATPLPQVTPVGRFPTATQTRGLRILLAEDVEENQVLFEAYLKQTPHQVVIANDGIEAVDRVQQETFDVVVMDVQMPRMDGYTATRKIRRWEQEMARHPLPIIALSAHVMEGERERSREAGCDHYLAKPIKRKKLLEALQQIASQTPIHPRQVAGIEGTIKRGQGQSGRTHSL